MNFDSTNEREISVLSHFNSHPSARAAVSAAAASEDGAMKDFKGPVLDRI